MAAQFDLISINQPQEWRESLKGLRHAFAHTWDYCYAMQLSSGLPTYLLRFRDGDVKIVCPVSERKYRSHTDIVTPFGISGLIGTGVYEGFSERWKAFARQKGYVCGYIVLHPLLAEDSYYGEEEAFTYNELFIIDLNYSEDHLLSSMSRGRKGNLKHYDEIAKNICFDKSKLSKFFLNHYRQFFLERNASPIYHLTEDSLSFLFKQEHVIMAGMLEGEQITAVSVFTYTKDMGDYLFHISIPEGDSASAYLIWYGLIKLKSLGIPYLNLGGGIQTGDSLAEFKRRFGAHVYPLTALKQVYQIDTYRELCRTVEVDPEDRSGYFPPYQNRNQVID